MSEPRGFLERRAADGVQATVEALYPVNDYGAPDHVATDMVRRTWLYLGDLPAPQRRLLVLLFAFTELAAPFLIPGFRRFSRLPVERREAAVRRFRRSRFFPLRVIGDSLKATTTLIYMSHPAALAYIGMYSYCARPEDPLAVPTRPGTLAEIETRP
jgi:hypothetical protein